MWDISRRLTITIAILHLFDSSYRTTEQVKQRTRRAHNEAKIAHLLYMDDLKLIAKSEEELRKEIRTVKTFSVDIYMDFGLEKRAKITFKKGKLIPSQNLMIDINREIEELEQGKT